MRTQTSIPDTTTVHMEHSIAPCASESEAIATLWALAKSSKPERARLWRGDAWVTNDHMRDQPVPEGMRRQVLSILRHLDEPITQAHQDDTPITFEEVIGRLPAGWRVEARQSRDIRGTPTNTAIWTAHHHDYYQGERPVTSMDANTLLAEVWTIERFWAEERL